MANLVTAMQSAINTDAMFTNLTLLIPVIGGVLLFSFTYRIVRKIVGGASKGKARV